MTMKAYLKEACNRLFAASRLTEAALDNNLLLSRLTEHAIPLSLQFDFDKLKRLTLGFVAKMRCDTCDFSYKYSSSCSREHLYSSAYAVMILSMYGELDKYSDEQKNEWIACFNRFQNSDDGLFYDPLLFNEIYNDTDWWGARHLAAHMNTAYTALGAKPAHPFKFLMKFYDFSYLKGWLDSQDWRGKFTSANDIDNKIMNVGVLLQYQRDYWGDPDAGKAVRFIQEYLVEKINSSTGMWGNYNLSDKNELSRMVQFAYHLFTLFFYDKVELGHKERIIDCVLKTQNVYGGFGVSLNSSACEDMDSLDILIRLRAQTDYRGSEVDLALKRALVWVLANQNEDGGFVFCRNESFVYGHQEMSSIKNESSMFATWFRTLTIAYLDNYFFEKNFNITKCPGYSF